MPGHFQRVSVTTTVSLIEIVHVRNQSSHISTLRAKKLDLKQFSLNHATPLVSHIPLIHWFQTYMLFRHALVPFIFRFRVRRLTNWISLQSSTSLGIINTPLRTHVVGMLDDGDIALCDLFGHIICRLIMLHGICLLYTSDAADD